ncbi:MAG: TRAP transporter permease DctQ [Muricauda sp.]|nr:TRAP transporter small permease [Allomuricauda sp.]MAU26806.1 TRAP transporter permease DctQ [Allomuricauda sp.]MBC30583.1 TRAP transporter permease DctQ [Allomuricauda sp.]|tara:strand:- start:152 stop:616 length:465 start_codon:yes stop_codon:yes gene_type:complete
MTTGFRKKLDSILGHALVLVMAVMVVNVLWQVFSRYVLGAPSSFTDELARFLMIWIGVLGAAYVAGRNGHVAIDVLARRTSGNNQKRLKQLVRIAIVLFCLFAMVIGGLRLVYVTYVLEQYSPALGLPLAVVYLVIPLSGLLIIYYKISDMLNS